MKNDERGVTLIELVITLAIFSVIGGILWNVFFQGYKYSQKSISKNSMVQEANLVLTNITRIHQKYHDYEIKSTGSPRCDITITPNINTTPQPQQVFSDSKMCFAIKIDGVDQGTTPITIEPNKKDVNLVLTVSDRKRPENTISINTLIYRVKGLDYQ